MMMKAVLLIVATLCVAAFAAPLSGEQYHYLFAKFVDQYNKVYESNDFYGKFQTFKSNVDLILAHNARGELETFKMGINQFADLTKQEFQQMLGFKPQSTSAAAIDSRDINQLLNEELSKQQRSDDINALLDYELQKPQESNSYDTYDWTTKGVLSPIQNQGQCGSCYSFSATAALEAHSAIKTKKLVKLSEQQVVDCSKSNNGCQGGLMKNVWNDLQKIGGQCLASGYAYTGKEGQCKSCTPAVKVTGTKFAKGEAALLTELKNGPIAMAVDASCSAIQFYQSGIITQTPDAKQLNHAVVLVKTQYKFDNDLYIYTIRNSWGSSWGESGNFRIAALKGLAKIGSGAEDCYPIVG